MALDTRIVKVPTDESLGAFDPPSSLDTWVPSSTNPAVADLRSAAAYLAASDTPVAFPTETVYGLGADATRSPAVRGIYAAKGRPSDNPLISHIADLSMLRALLNPAGTAASNSTDPIPAIYLPLIQRFWPGPLTILLPNPSASCLAPEVTAGQPTWGARMPRSPLALSLIKLAGVPLAAPSANASTKPSPTTARHVLDDLAGRIELILDGGSCAVGVESTVVDGLSLPPAILRPGGISIAAIRACPGWEACVVAYKDHSEVGNSKAAPRAPGMKYKHYSPKAHVTLYEASCADAAAGVVPADAHAVLSRTGGVRVGVIRTQRWAAGGGFTTVDRLSEAPKLTGYEDEDEAFVVREGQLAGAQGGVLYDIDLTSEVRGIAQGLFQALRALDRRGVDVVFVDGVADEQDIAGAVMNRLRKAASDIRS
ncbi:hypothetical protein TD95_004551 [Thielaviopsis punctulata]|uniref:Threonylcarbamoyl-AMP synthase n=1 Tax=Thielaviopsis punctulata TaxID=72032 RepID=A0A0F4ZDJ6_9PEZI|nr:hypothetical protein TD95_004551 [Thielaviopsis punctulata]